MGLVLIETADLAYRKKSQDQQLRTNDVLIIAFSKTETGCKVNK